MHSFKNHVIQFLKKMQTLNFFVLAMSFLTITETDETENDFNIQKQFAEQIYFFSTSVRTLYRGL